jgi:hypothetical protein
MSWTLAFNLSADEVKADALDPLDESPKSTEEHQVKQVEAAKAAAKAAVAAGALGSKQITGSISGHATADGEPGPSGYPTLSVSLSGVAPQTTDA